MKKSHETLKLLNQLASDLCFKLDQQQCEDLLLEFDAIEKQMEVVKKIDTNNVLALDFLFDVRKNYLRSDDVENPLPINKVLAAAGQVKGDYIVINRVISDEKD